MGLIDAFLTERASQTILTLRLHLENEDVLYAFSIGCWFEVVGVDLRSHSLHFFLQWVVLVVYRHACEVLAVTFDLNTMTNNQRVFLV